MENRGILCVFPVFHSAWMAKKIRCPAEGDLFRVSLEQFIQRVKRNSDLTELTPYALRELVKAVYVDAPDKSSGKRKQKIHISYDLIGFIPVDVLTKAEQV